MSEMKQKWCTRIELLVQRWTGKLYIVSPNKFIIKSFEFLANNLDIHLTWAYYILMITFSCTYVDKLKWNTYIF